MHERAFFALLLDGHYAENFRSQSWAYKPFTMGFHPEGMEHSDECGVDRSKFFLIELEKSWIERLRDYSSSTVQPCICDTRAAALAARLLHEHKQKVLYFPLLMEGLVLEILSTLIPDPVARKKPEWLSRVLEIFREEHGQKHTLRDIAQRLDLHPVYLARTFRKFVGSSPGQYLNRVRVQKALEQLANTEIAIPDIALAVGFADQSHLTRALKQETGMTPAAFQKAQR